MPHPALAQHIIQQ